MPSDNRKQNNNINRWKIKNLSFACREECLEQSEKKELAAVNEPGSRS
jgi:hypothetical protein